MNDFENVGVLLQLAAILILFMKIVFTRDCTGLSGRTQILYALAFSTRFLDLPDEFKVSLPCFVMKIVYLSIAYLTVAAIFVFCRQTYGHEHDSFRIDFLTGICALAAVATSYKNLDILAILWYFSVYLETCAILPQIYFSAKAQCAGSSLVFYVGMFACFRLFHVVHWSYTIYTRQLVDSYFVVVNGTVQLFIYSGYFGWMVPLFKGKYDYLRSINVASLGVAKAQGEVQTHDVTANGIRNCEC